MKYIKSFQVYRAKKSGDGCAFQFKMTDQSQSDRVDPKYRRFLCFLEATSQVKGTSVQDAKFNWSSKDGKNENHITAKLEPKDIGQLLAVIHRLIPDTKIFHPTEKARKNIELKNLKDDKNKELRFSLSMDCTDLQTNARIKYSAILGADEISIWKVVLEAALLRMYNL